jgi:DNA ligase-1
MNKPMLASHCKDTRTLKFPVLGSKKLDGVRAEMQGGQLLSRSLKPIPNKYVQELFAGLAEGTDGELIVGDPCAVDENGEPNACRKTVSLVMSDNKPLDYFHGEQLRLWVFDKFGNDGFRARLNNAAAAVIASKNPAVVLVKHVMLNNIEELDQFEADALADGNEGVMIRSMNGPYKEGRSTEREAYLLKLKRFVDTEAVVTGSYEWETNTNNSFTNELGRTTRSSCQDGKVGADMLGGLFVTGIEGDWKGIEFKVGTMHITQDERKKLWSDRDALVGRIAKLKFFPHGAKDKPRHPVFLDWRDERDM